MTKKVKEHFRFHYLLTAVYFDSFGIEYVSQEILNKIKDKSITHNIFRIQDNESIICGFYCIAFVERKTCRKNFVILYQFIFSERL